MEIRDQLDNTRSRLLDTISNLTEAELNWKPAEDAWSVAQVVEHVMLVEAGAAKAVRLGLKQERTFVPRALPLEKILPGRSRKVTAPEMTRPSDQPKTMAELTERLTSTRAKLLDMLAAVDNPDDLDTTSPPVPHPVFLNH